MIDVKELLRALVAIPSDRATLCEGGRVEYGVAMYLAKFLATHAPGFTVETQPVEEGRVNLFVHDGRPVNLLFLGHMDVVEDGVGWTKNVRGEDADGKFFGRGSADMKAGVAAIVSALVHVQESGKQGVAALFYADEEYDFKGMRSFLKDYSGKMTPALVVCPEPTQEALRPGCRGVAEWRVVIKGKRGHAARVHSGVSAFRALNAGVAALDTLFAGRHDDFLGAPTLNIAYVHCGSVLQSDEFGDPILSDAANVIPDFCEAVLEARTVPSVDMVEVEKVFRATVEEMGAAVESWETALRLGSFMSPATDLHLAEAAQREVLGKVVYEDASKGGYSDAQMIAQEWSVPVVIWGPTGGDTHGVDEWVDWASVERLSAAFQRLVDNS